MERLRTRKGLLVIVALMAVVFLTSCDDSEDEPEVFVGKSTMLETDTLTVSAEGELSGGTFSTADGSGNATGVAMLEVERGTLAYLISNVFPQPGIVNLVMIVSDWNSEPTFVDSDFTVTILVEEEDDLGVVTRGKVTPGVLTTGEVTTAGFVEIYMVDTAGDRIRKFGQNLTITLDVTNPNVEEGDLLEIWMYDEGEGWKIHSPEVNVYDENGLKIQFTTDHLTTFVPVVDFQVIATGSGGTTT